MKTLQRINGVERDSLVIHVGFLETAQDLKGADRNSEISEIAQRVKGVDRDSLLLKVELPETVQYLKKI